MRFLALIALLVPVVLSADEGPTGVSPEVVAENSGAPVEVFRLRIINTAGGTIEASRDAGASWISVGRVVAPVTRVNPKGFTASKWAAASAVCATAVNAIHIKVANNPETGRGMIFSLVPAGIVTGAALGRSLSSVVTDIPGGEGIFGGGLSPTINSPVALERDGLSAPLVADYAPAEGDALVIIARAPVRPVAELIFENKFGGIITLRYADGEEKPIGTVLRPVIGIGRFPGTVDAAAGRVRANHAGVIDISTSPLGMVGGFQIIPRGHAGSPEMSYVVSTTQWMVVGPISALDPSWEGIAPLFAGFLAPDYRPDDITGRHDDWMQRLLSRCLVQARVKSGPWQNMPRIVVDPDAPEEPVAGSSIRRIRSSLNPYVPLARKAYTALAGVTHLRIILPSAQFWPEGAD